MEMIKMTGREPTREEDGPEARQFEWNFYGHLH